MRSAFFAAALLLAGAPALASGGVGDTPAAREFRVPLPGGVLTLEPLTPRIVRVRFGDAAFTGNHSPAVVGKFAPARYSVSRTGQSVVLVTAALKVDVDASTGKIVFATSGGKVLLQDDGRDVRQGVEQRFYYPGANDPPLFGLGQHQNGLLDYTGTTVHLQQANRDVAVPMLTCALGFGILWNNASVTDVDVGLPSKAPLVIRSEAGQGVDYDFIYGPEFDDIIGGYRELTGDAPLMARWTWGLWQSKERYASQGELLAVVDGYRSRDLPLDAVVQDWQYWPAGEWGSHRFEGGRYPDPHAMLQALHAAGVHAIVSVWPRFDGGTANAAELERAGVLFPRTYSNVYPAGQGRWYDAWSPAGRELYWRQIMRSLGTLGFDGWWLDGSEAELGGAWGQMRDVTTAAGPGAVVYNSFPLMHTAAVHDGMLRDQPGKRPFILTRSAWAGQQRNAAITWSGDTMASWDVLRRQVPAALNFSLSGIPYWSADIGGFFGGDPRDPAYAELFTRWYEFAVFNPMFRVHGTGAGKEPWRFDARTQAILADQARLRYRLLPYLYSTSWDVTARRGTMMRALGFDFRDDETALRIPDEYMFGKALLVAPVLQPGATVRTVYLPGRQAWYDFDGGRKHAGGQVLAAPAQIDRIPVFVRAGSILPLGPVKMHADARSDEPVEIRVYPGRDASFDLYDDAGDGQGYLRGQHAIVHLAWSEKLHRLEIGAREGAFEGMASTQDFVVVCGAGGTDGTRVAYAGRALRVDMAACGRD